MKFCQSFVALKCAMLTWNLNLLPIRHLSSPWDVFMAFILVEKLEIYKYQAVKIYILLNVCPNILFNIKIKGHSRLNKVLEIFYWLTKCIQSSSYCITLAIKIEKPTYFPRIAVLVRIGLWLYIPLFKYGIWIM